MAKRGFQLIRLSAGLGDVLTDESVEDEFSHIIRRNTGFLPKGGISLRQTNYPSQTDNSSLIQIRPMSHVFLALKSRVYSQSNEKVLAILCSMMVN